MTRIVVLISILAIIVPINSSGLSCICFSGTFAVLFDEFGFLCRDGGNGFDVGILFFHFLLFILLLLLVFLSVSVGDHEYFFQVLWNLFMVIFLLIFI